VAHFVLAQQVTAAQMDLGQAKAVLGRVAQPVLSCEFDLSAIPPFPIPFLFKSYLNISVCFQNV
jgi:hypothetical protein